VTTTPAAQVPLTGLTGTAAPVHDAADATYHAVSVVPAARTASPDAMVKVAVSVCDCELVVFVVLVKVILPVETSDALPAATTSSLPSVVAAQPVVVPERVAAPTPSVAVAVADQ
jgi:hypothetical protein